MIITKKKKKDYTQRWKSRAVQWKKVKAVQHTNKKQKGDWQDRNPPEEEENNKKKKKRKQEEEGSETQKKKKEEVRFFFFKPKSSIGRNMYFGQNWPKLAGMARTLRNRPKFDPRWNEGYYGTGFHAGTKYSGHSGRNGT